MTCCPTCGHELRDDGLLHVDPAGIVVAGAQFARLTRRELSLLESLRAVTPRLLTKEHLLADIYWGVADPDMVAAIRRESFARLTAHAEAFRKLSGGSAETAVTKALAELYNKGKRVNTIVIGEHR